MPHILVRTQCVAGAPVRPWLAGLAYACASKRRPPATCVNDAMMRCHRSVHAPSSEKFDFRSPVPVLVQVRTILRCG
jgi:hypothetical protein